MGRNMTMWCNMTHRPHSIYFSTRDFVVYRSSLHTNFYVNWIFSKKTHSVLKYAKELEVSFYDITRSRKLH